MSNPTRQLEVADAPVLARLLAEQRAEYVAHFHPFPFDAESLGERVRGAREDRYWALLHAGELAGFFMLRGWDEGYARAAFGVFVGEKFAGRGLARLALEESIAYARERKTPALILKVATENVRARALYVAMGFVPAGRCERSGQEMMELSLVPSGNECQNTVST
jgi:RimJ/RimL family protein N-acetyltransferase